MLQAERSLAHHDYADMLPVLESTVEARDRSDAAKDK